MVPETLDRTIDMFFNITDDRVQYTSEANTPFLPEQVLQMAYHAVKYYEIYTYACND